MAQVPYCDTTVSRGRCEHRLIERGPLDLLEAEECIGRAEIWASSGGCGQWLVSGFPYLHQFICVTIERVKFVLDVAQVPQRCRLRYAKGQQNDKRNQKPYARKMFTKLQQMSPHLIGTSSHQEELAAWVAVDTVDLCRVRILHWSPGQGLRLLGVENRFWWGNSQKFRGRSQHQLRLCIMQSVYVRNVKLAVKDLKA